MMCLAVLMETPAANWKNCTTNSTETTAFLTERRAAMDNDICRNCVFWTGNRLYDLAKGECHRRAPVLLPDKSTAWPSVSSDDWCGEFSETIEEMKRRMNGGY